MIEFKHPTEFMVGATQAQKMLLSRIQLCERAHGGTRKVTVSLHKMAQLTHGTWEHSEVGWHKARRNTQPRGVRACSK